MKTNSLNIQFILIGTGIIFLASVMPASASLKQMKLYKEAFPDAKPKCVQCHVDEKPKKDDGLHAPNAYGKAILDAAKEPTADTYKKVGAIENFKK